MAGSGTSRPCAMSELNPLRDKTDLPIKANRKAVDIQLPPQIAKGQRAPAVVDSRPGSRGQRPPPKPRSQIVSRPTPAEEDEAIRAVKRTAVARLACIPTR
jgi:hypothetical protein